MAKHAESHGANLEEAQKLEQLTARVPKWVRDDLEREAAALGNVKIGSVMRRRLEASVTGNAQVTRMAVLERKLDQILATQIAFRDQTFKETADQHSARILDMVNLQATSIDEVTQLRDVVIEAFEALKGALIALEKHVKPRKQT